MRTDQELRDAILENLKAKPLNVLQLARLLHETTDRIHDVIMDLERRGKIEPVPLAKPYRVR